MSRENEKHEAKLKNHAGANPRLAALRYPGDDAPVRERLHFWVNVVQYTQAEGTRCAALCTIERLLGEGI